MKEEEERKKEENRILSRLEREATKKSLELGLSILLLVIIKLMVVDYRPVTRQRRRT